MKFRLSLHHPKENSLHCWLNSTIRMFRET